MTRQSIGERKQKSSKFIKGQIPWNKGKTFNREIKNCEICGKEISVTKGYLKQRNRRFCSADCRNTYFAQFPSIKKCENCGKEFRDRMNGDRRYCQQSCYWEKLKEIHTANGRKYSHVKNDEGKRMYLHRLIMENHLGRKLLKTEIVHHIDGDSANNDLSNLELLSQKEHIKKHFSPIGFGKA